MKVCVVGSGGREHALVDALSRTAEVVITPGNPGIAESVADRPEDIEADLYVIGPEAPLVDGLADRLRAMGRVVFGPGADGALLEGSKAWMKEVVAAAGVPTASYATFEDLDDALGFLAGMVPPFVIKTDGLAAGKGVLVTDSLTEARNAVGDYLSGHAFGEAGRRVVIEEGLSGPELSVLAVCDGNKGVLLAPAQDFKRVGDGDNGPNTGGMGAYSPVPFVNDELLQEVQDNFITPTLAELRKRGIDYRGVLYAGLMLTPSGLKLIEYNVRFGDPETQVVLPRFDGDLANLLLEAANGDLRTEPQFHDEACVTVVCAAQGYPSTPRSGDVISGIADAEAADGVNVYCAGVTTNDDGQLVTSGGRVLNVTATGETLAAARARAYEAAARISWEGMFHRSDIAAEAAAQT
ncbi:MAG: phosphoribosylamine--glycine ligase [Microthrixaceae bacterium]|nr:phosphoribosylamine--glycine ligase [Microthrixaceae bacterium]